MSTGLGLVVVSPPAALPVSLAEAKAQLRVEADVTDEDALISGMIAAAVGMAERFMGRALVDTTFDYFLDVFPEGARPIVVPRPPLIEVLEIATRDPDGNEEALTGFSVDTAAAPGRIFLRGAAWPRGSYGLAGIRIRYRAGYIRMEGSPLTAVGDIPADIHAALLLYIGQLYQNREPVVIGASMLALPWSTEALLRQHRVEMSLA